MGNNELKYRVVSGILEMAGESISNLILKPNYDEEEKIKNHYFEEAIQIARENKQGYVKINNDKPINEEIIKEKQVSVRETKTEACVACSRNHVAAIAGLLSEGKRFLKDGGITNSAVTERIDLATQELTAMERGDLHPNKLQNLPDDEREIAEWAANELRNLRHVMDHISTKEDYMTAIQVSSDLSREITKKYYDMMSKTDNIDKFCKNLKDEDYKRCISTINTVLKNKSR